MNSKKLIIVSIIIAVIACWFIFDLNSFFSLEYAKQQQQNLQQTIIDAPLLSSVVYFTLYILMTALSLPGAAFLTLLGAALFGFWWSLLLVSFASAIGATVAFLLSRFLLKEWVQTKYGHRLKTMNQGIERDGAFYLFTLRLIPVFPFFLLNLLMGLTPIRTVTYYWASQLGMLAGTMVYLNVGTQLGQLESLSGLISPTILLSLALLGLFPLVAKKIINLFQQQKVYRQWKKPTTFDQNMVVIGAGSGGLVSAYIAAAVKAKVTLVEKHKMGGDCLNTGCVPSKALIRIAHSAAEVKKMKQFGIDSTISNIDFQQVMGQIKRVIKTVEPHDSIERYTELGVDCVTGEAKILNPWQVHVNGKTLTSKNIVIATGARPFIPPFPGLDNIHYVTSDTIWDLEVFPKKLLVLGGGPIGSEISQSFARLGAQVTLVDRGDQLLNREDSDAATVVLQHLLDDNVNVLLNHNVVEFEQAEGKQRARLVHVESKEPTEVEFDYVMIALGRAANTTGFGLEELGIELNSNGTIATNTYLQTKYPNIYAVGDVAGPFQLTHAASHQAWYAAVNALFGSLKKFKTDYSVLPAVTYTSPELARVGINEKEAKEQQIPYEVTLYSLDDLDRAIAEDETAGFVKILTVPNSDKILGVTIVGHLAGELLAEYTLAMRHNLGLNKILETIHPYPTMSEANKYAAGVWKRNHAPEKVLAWVKRFHQWQLQSNKKNK
ncbi:dihydrolipoyl dehydrogenase [Vibrio sp. SS-MA-C1-2]|uniref:dihydrolipoyl dehydrogenase n=1 Tax=Vibrio sp. SS-MA-C1-2 TaxID=2908646 RepID=UPI001F451B6D|nr:dihydrolipoyl dehydrogenase [Vibrio sp. SS-MA-C1-2]UJF17051.1 dihydrolipoyl dehydrogenase [Vibrio sp. SS-MA-C1-2]